VIQCSIGRGLETFLESDRIETKPVFSHRGVDVWCDQRRYQNEPRLRHARTHAFPGDSPAVDDSVLMEPTLDEQALRAAISSANIPTLLMVMTQLTGDLHWLEPPYVLSRTKGMSDNDTGGLPEDLQQEVRDAAAEAIIAWERGKPVAIPQPTPNLIVQMLSVSMGERVAEEYGEMFAADLAAVAGGAAAEEPLLAPDGFTVLIIGAGISGLAAAIKLQRLGIPYTIVERREDVGGVWLENRYPGAGVDVPSHLYSYSFEPYDWTRYFAGRDEIFDYIHSVADKYSVRANIRFGTSVQAIEWEEVSQKWIMHASCRGEILPPLRVNLVLSCVGAFNPPVVPNIPGLDTFGGPCFHTALWPEDLDLTGKTVAVVGNGASAMQVVPAIAPIVSDLVVFQRSPQWAQPFEKFLKPVPDSVRLLIEKVPLYRAWFRLRMSWIFHDKLYQALQRDPDWSSTASINRVNDGHREYFTEYIRRELGDRQDLLDKVLPKYPPFGKRMLQDNGWFRTLTRPNVRLVNDAVVEVGPQVVRTAAGETYPVDVLVMATGFDVVHFVSTYEVIGRGGLRLRDAWDDDNCRAYLGLTIPDMPNFFTIYGPNTQTGHGGSLIHTVEDQLDYVADLLGQMFCACIDAVDVKQETYDAFADTVDRMHEGMIWSHPGMTTYYRNSRGRVVALSPFRNVDYWRMTRHADLRDYVTSASPARQSLANAPTGVTPTQLGPERHVSDVYSTNREMDE
jgi:4-hydroxyacetophenone monooxygenase